MLGSECLVLSTECLVLSTGFVCLSALVRMEGVRFVEGVEGAGIGKLGIGREGREEAREVFYYVCTVQYSTYSIYFRFSFVFVFHFNCRDIYMESHRHPHHHQAPH